MGAVVVGIGLDIDRLLEGRRVEVVGLRPTNARRLVVGGRGLEEPGEQRRRHHGEQKSCATGCHDTVPEIAWMIQV